MISLAFFRNHDLARLLSLDVSNMFFVSPSAMTYFDVRVRLIHTSTVQLCSTMNVRVRLWGVSRVLAFVGTDNRSAGVLAAVFGFVIVSVCRSYGSCSCVYRSTGLSSSFIDARLRVRLPSIQL